MMLFSTSLAGPALDWAQHEPLSTIESWIDFREAFLKRFARLPPFKSKYNHYSHQLEEEWGGIPPHPEVLNEELIKHVERNPFYNSTSECAKEHLCNFEQLCHDYGLGDNPKKIQLFQLSLAGQAKEWAKFMPNMLSRLGMDTKELSFTDLPRSDLCSTTTPQLFTTPSIITRHKSDTTFPQGEYQAARQTKIEEMLQEYLKNQDESTKKMERRIDSSMNKNKDKKI
ncbi:unnamed protein product [Microthlaspi erraticum]|uniref:Retrotransposon gag domain-containing protein n=1 Tax=Microthlaspi erraticum TaxID=1685480 RepID=A0A6D2K4F3_9BRAS|nr:unnamed protein product [Microthlaspi erraticum]